MTEKEIKDQLAKEEFKIRSLAEANELADGNRPSLWITPEGKLFFKNER